MVLGRLSRRLRSTESGTAAGLTPTKVSILFAVVREGPLRMSELAEGEGVNPTMLSRAVAGLADKQLIVRRADEADRRVAWVESTDAGRELVESMRRERTDAVRVAFDALPAGERAALQCALPALELLSDQITRGSR